MLDGLRLLAGLGIVTAASVAIGALCAVLHVKISASIKTDPL